MRDTFWDRLRKVVPSRYDDPDVRLFKTIIYVLIGAILLTGLAGITTFLFSVRGAEETMVPDVQNEDLLSAMLSIQERGLYSEVEQRYAADPALTGRVLQQDPPAGTLVRAGKRIDIVVSRGARVDRIGEYIGRQLSEVRAELRAFAAGDEQTIQIGSVIYDFSTEDAGTILQQNPEPGTEITTITEIDLVVSRGEDVARVMVPSYIGIPFQLAVERLSQNNIPFTFEVRAAEPEERPGLVISQDPSPQTSIEIGGFVDLVMTEPEDLTGDEVFGVLERTLPEYPTDVELSLEVQTADGEREVIWSMLHPGRRLSVPFIVAENSSLVLYRSGQEIYRTVARAQAENTEDE
ncbi:MAG: PASTA domain-containing protein [Spirochaetales bacterium]